MLGELTAAVGKVLELHIVGPASVETEAQGSCCSYIEQISLRSSPMPTRYSAERGSSAWGYPTDVPGFLKSLGTSLDDPKEARTRVGIFMVLPVAKRMPLDLRRQLIETGLFDPRSRPDVIPHI